MQYMITWHERPMGSAAEYEAAQERILRVFGQWEMPASLRIREFLVRVGEFGGYLLLDTEVPLDIHRLTSAFPAFRFKVEPVLGIEPAVAAEMDAILWRKALG